MLKITTHVVQFVKYHDSKVSVRYAMYASVFVQYIQFRSTMYMYVYIICKFVLRLRVLIMSVKKNDDLFEYGNCQTLWKKNTILCGSIISIFRWESTASLKKMSQCTCVHTRTCTTTHAWPESLWWSNDLQFLMHMYSK